jgi:hypothetical protein
MVKTRQRANTVRENRDLRRENNRLKKRINQLENSIESMTSMGEPENNQINNNDPVINGACCPKCGDGIKELDLGQFTYRVCGSDQCNYRERK